MWEQNFVGSVTAELLVSLRNCPKILPRLTVKGCRHLKAAAGATKVLMPLLNIGRAAAPEKAVAMLTLILVNMPFIRAIILNSIYIRLQKVHLNWMAAHSAPAV